MLSYKCKCIVEPSSLGFFSPSSHMPRNNGIKTPSESLNSPRSFHMRTANLHSAAGTVSVAASFPAGCSAER